MLGFDDVGQFMAACQKQEAGSRIQKEDPPAAVSFWFCFWLLASSPSYGRSLPTMCVPPPPHGVEQPV